MDQKVSREREVDWLSKKLANLEIDKAFSLAAEVDRKIIASASIDRLEGFQKHVGLARVIIKKEFRDMDIGIGIMKILEEQAHNMGLKVLTLSVFATNKRAFHVYEKVGFVQTEVVPKNFSRLQIYR